MILGIVEKLNEWVEPAKAWLDANRGNPFVWLAFVLIGLGIFAVTYSSLHRD